MAAPARRGALVPVGGFRRNGGRERRPARFPAHEIQSPGRVRLARQGFPAPALHVPVQRKPLLEPEPRQTRRETLTDLLRLPSPEGRL